MKFKILKKINYQFDKVGIHICIISLILISFSFAYLPLSKYIDSQLFPILIVGVSLISLLFTFFQRNLEFRIGTYSYFFLILLVGPIYLSGFEQRDIAMTTLYSGEWEVGMHIIIIGLIMQYFGSLCVNPKKSIKCNQGQKRGKEDDDIDVGYKKVMHEILKEIALGFTLLTFILVIVFIILIAIKVLEIPLGIYI